MARLSAAIMAHPIRAPYVAELQTQLDRDVPVIYDHVPTPSADPAQRWAVATRAWQHHDPLADWHLVIQDDAIVCADLLAGLEKALDQLHPRSGPTRGLVSAYTGTGRPDQRNVNRAIDNATTNGHAWLDTRSLNWGVAIIAPVCTIPAMLDWCSQPERSTHNADYRIGCYYRDIKHWRTWHTWPSLVDHRDTIPSLVGHDGDRTGGRHAHVHHQGSALEVDWTRTPPGGLNPRLPNRVTPHR